MSKIREMLSDDKHDWEHRVVAVRLTSTHSTGLKCVNPVMINTDVCCCSTDEEGPLSHAGRSG